METHLANTVQSSTFITVFNEIILIWINVEKMLDS